MMVAVMRTLAVVSLGIGTVLNSCSCIEAFHSTHLLKLRSGRSIRKIPLLGESAKEISSINPNGAFKNESDTSDWREHPEEHWRYSLPHQLQRYQRHSMRRLQCTTCDGEPLDVYVIGTAHTWKESARDVRLLLETVCPDLIMIESCWERFGYMCITHLEKKGDSSDGTDSEFSPLHESLSYKQKVAKFFIKSNTELMAENMQNEAEKHGTIMGAEFLTAIQYWNETHSMLNRQAPVEGMSPFATSPILLLGDMPIDFIELRLAETMKRREKLAKRIRPLRTGLKMLGIAALSGIASVILSKTRLEVATTLARRMMCLCIGAAVFSAALYTQSVEKRFIDALFETFDDDTPGSLDRALELLRDMVANSESYYRTLLFDPKYSSLLSISDKGDFLVQERDRYMACKLFQGIGGIQPRDDGSDGDLDSERKRRSAVVVLGSAHVPGLSDFFCDLCSDKEDYVEVLASLVESDGYFQKYDEEQVKDLITGSAIVEWRQILDLLESNFNLEPHETSV